MSLRTERFVIASINRTNDGNFSYSKGNPVIRFDFAATNKLLDTSSLRLCCKVRMYKGDGNAPNNNQNATGNPAFQSQLSANNGTASLLNTVSLTTGSGASIETIRNYPRLVASVLQQTNSWGDYSTNLMYLQGSTANDKCEGRMCNLASGNKGKEYSFSVAMPLLCGFLMRGDNINLSNRGGIGGMSVSLTLSPDVFSVFGADAAGLGGSYIEMIDPVLTGQFIIPNDDRDLPDTGTIVYNSWTALYNVNQASDNTYGYNLGLGAVVSQFNNNIPVPNINNYLQNCSLTTQLLRNDNTVPPNQIWKAPITTTSTEKGGVFYPLDFVVDEDKNAPTSAAASSTDAYQDPVFDALRFRYSLDSIKPYRRTSHLLAGAVSENVMTDSAWTGKYNYNNPQVYDYGVLPTGRDYVINGTVFSVGTRYDGLGTGTGSVDFKNSQFSERLTSKLDGNSPNGLYSYFLHRAAVNFSPQGVSVSV